MSQSEQFKSSKSIQERVRDMDDELVKKYQLSLLGEGAEQMVFDVDGHPDIVVKVNKDSLVRVIRYNLEHKLPLDVIDSNILERAKKYAADFKKDYIELKSFFGESATKERVYVMVVPFPVELLDEETQVAVHQVYPSLKEGKSHALVRVQERVKAEQAREDLLSPSRGVYLERLDDLSAADYERANQLITGAEADPIAIDEILANRSEIAGDPSLRGCVADFTEKAIAFTKATGKTLDLAGEGNVIFFKDDKGWHYKMPDALYPKPGARIFLSSRELLARVLGGEALHEGETSDLMNGLAYTRQINAIAQACGVEERLKLVKELSPAENALVVRALRSRDL